MISLPLTSPAWVDRHSLEVVAGPTLPADLVGNWDLALTTMDHGLLRLRVMGDTLVLETTDEPKAVLTHLRTLPVDYFRGCAYIRVVNLRTQLDQKISLHDLLTPRVSTLAASLRKKPLLDYRFPDICDAATPREQHHAVYGSRLTLDWMRLDLETASKTLTFTHPAGFPHIRFATRHPVLGLRNVYLVVGLQADEARRLTEPQLPVAWAHPWDGVVWSDGALRPLDLRDADAVAEEFGEFDLAAVNWILRVAAHAHGWNHLPFPRAWENANSHLRI